MQTINSNTKPDKVVTYSALVITTAEQYLTHFPATCNILPFFYRLQYLTHSHTVFNILPILLPPAVIPILLPPGTLPIYLPSLILDVT